jgi:phospholipid/cholesterol/gamma-HCH transport system ATP-binding protein
MTDNFEDVAIELKDVKKSFGESVNVLDGVNLNIPKGKITVIIGFSGAGKSVTLKHILGLLKPNEGSVTVLGKDLSSLSEHELNDLRKRFGMLFQSAALFDDLSSIENVAFPIREFRRKLSDDEVLKLAKEKLQVVGLSPGDYDKYPSELSGGMRKRVGLARALALEPEILLYDEPTTGLDPIISEMVDKLIVETHHHRPGITTVIISHDLPSAFKIADYIAMLDGGKVRLFGTPKDFFESQDPFISKFVKKARDQE